MFSGNVSDRLGEGIARRASPRDATGGGDVPRASRVARDLERSRATLRWGERDGLSRLRRGCDGGTACRTVKESIYVSSYIRATDAQNREGTFPREAT